MSARIAVVAIAGAIAIGTGCSDRGTGTGTGTSTSATTSTSTNIPALTGLFTCKAHCPTLPSAYGGVAFGMPKAAIVKALAPAVVDDRGDTLDVSVGAAPTPRAFTIALAPDGTLRAIDEHVDPTALTALGPPLVIVFDRGPQLVWVDPMTRLKLSAQSDDPHAAGSGDRVRYEHYTPLAALLAADGLVARPMLGKTHAAIDAAYPDLDDLDHDGTTESPALLGTETMPTHLHVVWQFGTGAHPSTNADPLTSYSISIPIGSGPSARGIADEILAQVATTLGAPIGIFAEGNLVTYRFHGPAATVIELRRDLHATAWTLDVHAP